MNNNKHKIQNERQKLDIPIALIPEFDFLIYFALSSCLFLGSNQPTKIIAVLRDETSKNKKKQKILVFCWR